MAKIKYMDWGFDMIEQEITELKAKIGMV